MGCCLGEASITRHQSFLASPLPPAIPGSGEIDVAREALNKSPLARRWLCGRGCAKGDDANGATAQGGTVSSEGRCDPVAGCLRPNKTVVRSKHPLRCPIPASRGPSGHALGSHRVALLGIVVPATTCVARLMIIPILPATRSVRIYPALP